MITLEDINIVIEEIKKNNSRECINIIIEENNSLNLTDSKFGGLPYVSTDEDIPKDSNGNQLATYLRILYIQKRAYYNFGLAEMTILV